jgi:hypothetical protein
MSEEEIKQCILDSHMRSQKKIVHWVQTQIPHANEEEIKAVLESLNPKDRYRMSKGEHSKHYYYPIYTPFRGGYQMDLLEQSKRTDGTGYPPYFFIAINVNTRYGYAYPAKSKDAATVIPIIDKWVTEVRAEAPLVNISADQEGAWKSKEAEDYFKNHNIALNLIDHDRHSALGIIDRFIRTLRDMNIRTQDSKHQTKERKFRDFTKKKMAKILQIYNTSVHSAIEMTPADMAADPEAEKQYIIDKLYEVERRHKIVDYELPVGTWVRFMVPRNQMHKRRFQVSQEFVWIANKQGNSYVCMAKDGTIKRISRWRLFAYSNELPEGQNILESWKNNFGVIGKVVGGPRLSNYGNPIYKVNWQTPPGCAVQSDRWDQETVVRGQKNGSDLIGEWLRQKEGLRRVDRIVKKNGDLYQVHWDSATDEYDTDETERTIKKYPNGSAALDSFNNQEPPVETHVAIPVPAAEVPAEVLPAEDATPVLAAATTLKAKKITYFDKRKGYHVEISDGTKIWMTEEEVKRLDNGDVVFKRFKKRKRR